MLLFYRQYSGMWHWCQVKTSAFFWPNTAIRRDFSQTGRCMAPYATNPRQRIRESLVQGEPSPALDKQLSGERDWPRDTCIHSDAPGRAGSEQRSPLHEPL